MPGSDPVWLREAVDRLGAVLADEPEMAALFGPILKRLGGDSSADSLRAAFTRVLSTPFLRLLALLANDLGVDDERVTGLGVSTAWLYLYVRIQDDLVDEPDTTPRELVFAMERALSESLAAHVQAIPWAGSVLRRCDQMARFAQVMAAEALARDGADLPRDLAWTGGKFLPVAVALCALAADARGPAVADSVEAVVLRLGVAWQLANDAHDVARDHAAGRLTPLLRRCAEAGEAPTAVSLLVGRALPEAVAEALALVDEARALAEGAGLVRLAAAADDAAERLRRLPERLMAEVLGLQAA